MIVYYSYMALFAGQCQTNTIGITSYIVIDVI